MKRKTRHVFVLSSLLRLIFGVRNPTGLELRHVHQLGRLLDPLPGEFALAEPPSRLPGPQAHLEGVLHGQRLLKGRCELGCSGSVESWFIVVSKFVSPDKIHVAA